MNFEKDNIPKNKHYMFAPVSLKMKWFFIIPLLMMISSCELLSEEINECIFKITPKLPKKTLVKGQIGIPYYESVSAYIKNADDGAYDYEFSIEGNLPPGIQYQSDGRLLEFFGSPTQSGNYSFKVKVKLPNVIYGPGDGFCFSKDTDKQSYTIEVFELN